MIMLKTTTGCSFLANYGKFNYGQETHGTTPPIIMLTFGGLLPHAAVVSRCGRGEGLSKMEPLSKKRAKVSARTGAQ